MTSLIHRAAVACLVAGLTVACNADNGRSGIDFSGTETTGMSTTDPGTSGTDTDPSDTDGSSSTTDPTADPTTTGPGSTGSTGGGSEDGTTTDAPVVPCIGVDLLFVVDNSTGMAEKQGRLLATAQGFADMVRDGVTSAGGDVNMAVITTDESSFVTPMGGTYLSGEAFMTAASTDGMELGVALDVGESGDPNERPMDMVIEALTTEAEVGQPNEGFLREDALLVIVLLTDEEDDLEQVTQWGSSGDPAGWTDTVEDVKTYLRNVVPLSIVPTGASSCSDDMDAPRLVEFTDGFPRGATHDVCDTEYGTFLMGQIGSLNQACDLFVSP
jgi:hypothetical protein